jgi:hypothetical protein
MKQTAVEWLEQEFIALQNYGINELGLFSKAKEMEKEQIINAAYKNGTADEYDNKEHYYNNTFKSEQ